MSFLETDIASFIPDGLSGQRRLLTISQDLSLVREEQILKTCLVKCLQLAKLSTPQ